MSTRIDYTQIAAKLDYAALEKKLTQLAERDADVHEPVPGQRMKSQQRPSQRRCAAQLTE